MTGGGKKEAGTRGGKYDVIEFRRNRRIDRVNLADDIWGKTRRILFDVREPQKKPFAFFNVGSY